MWLTILLIALLAFNLLIGAYLYIKKIRDTKKYYEEWCRKRIFWPWYRKNIHSPWRRKIVTRSLILNIVCLPFAALFLPWDTLGEYIKTKLYNKHPYLADIVGHVFAGLVVQWAFFAGIYFHFVPPQKPWTITLSIIIISVIAFCCALSILNTRWKLKEARENEKKPV